MSRTPPHPAPTSRCLPWTQQGWLRVAVYGLGLSGRAAARLLLARGVTVVGLDDRPSMEIDPQQQALRELIQHEAFELRAEFDTGSDAAGATSTLLSRIDAIVVSPGVPPSKPLLSAARRAGLPVVAEVELAFPLLAGPVLGITGTNGKSTTTELAGAMLRAAGQAVEVCGNIGQPLSDRVSGEPGRGAEGRCFVVELSSFQLEALSTFRCRAAALLNVTPDHLDRYADFDAYAGAKKAIFERQEADDVAVLNADDPWIAAWIENGCPGMHGTARRRTFSHRAPVADGCYLDGDAIIEVQPESAPVELFRRTDVHLSGLHNLENAMAAALLARARGAAPQHLRRALADFRPLPHRMQVVRELDGVAWYDDSKGTNAAATAKSLADLPDGTVHLILGGVHKGDDLSDLRELVQRKVRRLYLIGEAKSAFQQAFAGAAPCEDSVTLESAVQRASRVARAGEAVLLSPACASYDQFQSYAHRGRRFCELVAALPEVVN